MHDTPACAAEDGQGRRRCWERSDAWGPLGSDGVSCRSRVEVGLSLWLQGGLVMAQQCLEMMCGLVGHAGSVHEEHACLVALRRRAVGAEGSLRHHATVHVLAALLSFGGAAVGAGAVFGSVS